MVRNVNRALVVGALLIGMAAVPAALALTVPLPSTDTVKALLVAHVYVESVPLVVTATSWVWPPMNSAA